MPVQLQPQQLPQPSSAAVDGNEWGLDEAEIEAVFATLQTPPRPPIREATVLPQGQVELTEEDLQALIRIQQREAEGRVRKTTYGSELLPSVVGHNRSEQKHTQRLVKQWFYEQRYQLDKVGNAQRDTYRQLRQLHVDRRRQARELMNYRREEARAEVERERERQRRAKELALLEKQMERLRREEELEMRSSTPVQRLPPVRRVKELTARGADAVISAVAAATATETEVKAATEEERRARPLPSNQRDAATEQEVVTLTAKVIEVNRRGMQAARQGTEEMAVLERSRSKSFIRESTGLKAVPQPQKPPQQPPQPPPQQKTSEQPPPPPAPSKPKTRTVAVEEVLEPPQPQPPLTERLPPLTQVERNRRHAKRKEVASRRLLAEPYRHYRMTREGEIEPVEFLPAGFPTTEPSNRPLYEQHKRLERERASYVASMNRLGRYTAELLNESIRLADVFEQPKEKAGGKTGVPRELRLGPTDWMKIFIRTNAPEDVEAGSFEAMKYIEYLRPEAPNTDRDLSPEKVFEDV